MLVISGNITLMARAAQMVLTCNPSSDATPAGKANWKSRAATGALAANNSGSAGVAAYGGLAGTDSGLVGDTAAFSTQHGVYVLWAWSMAPETAIEAANANQRPRPLANRSLPTNSTLLSCPTRCGNLRYVLVVRCGG